MCTYRIILLIEKKTKNGYHFRKKKLISQKNINSMECEIKSMVLAAISVVHMDTVFCEYTDLTKGNWFTTWHIIKELVSCSCTFTFTTGHPRVFFY